ncbi:helix-turn-helix domain-containing protein [Bacteroides intestinalis]|jgi:hypothetical protein|uniref:helix-turn-helix domain-containing protein n=1 Tax=Bacteroides intestinalis TaxID=329854 RepID=UPI002FDA757D
MELINGNSELIKEFFQSMDRMLDGISRLAKESRPHLNGEKFLSNREAANYLKVSIRTLQEWRDTGVIGKSTQSSPLNSEQFDPC